jgi:hemerythrin
MEVQEAVLSLLKNWLTHHILQEDKAYVPFSRQLGVKVMPLG